MLKIIRRYAGLTLLELLVVIAIIGITSTIIIVTMDPGTSENNTRREAKRLMHLLGLAMDEGIITGSDTGFAITPNGYQFLQHTYENEDETRKEWRVLGTTGALRPRVLPPTVSLELLNVDGFSPSSTNTDGEQYPQVFFLSSGEVTPFELSVIDEYGTGRYRITGLINGSIRLDNTTDD